MKRWYESKTIWTNVLIFVVLFLGYLGNDPLYTQYAVQINMVVAAANILLRLITTEKIQ
jgi:hypothetical protein